MLARAVGGGGWFLGPRERARVQAEWARGWMKGVGVGRVSEIYPLHSRGIYIRGTLEVEWTIWVLSHSALYSMPRYPTLDHSKAKHARNHQPNPPNQTFHP